MPHLNHGWTFVDRVSAAAAGSTVHEFYVRHYPHWPAAVWCARLRRGQVTVDGAVAGPDQRLRAGQVLRYSRSPWWEPDVPTDVAVLYGDADLLAVRKPAGLPCMPGGGFLENTLLHLVRARHGEELAPVHRLGRATSGIVLFARSALARQRLSAAFRDGTVRKVYRALVQGAGIQTPLAIEAPIGQVPYAPLGRVHAAAASGRPARTLVRVLERRAAADQALVEVEIATGRAHQIRIHLAAAGHPLAGDGLYAPGGLPVAPAPRHRPVLPGDSGYHLHAARVEFAHPRLGNRFAVLCAPPAALQTAGERADALDAAQGRHA